jgi:hypothetical protein
MQPALIMVSRRTIAPDHGAAQVFLFRLMDQMLSSFLGTYHIPIYILAFFGIAQVNAQADSTILQSEGRPLPAWQQGMLDIHHINTGRGNAAYCILPDGTTLQIDAGELAVTDSRTFTPRNATIRPDSSKKPYEWIAHYIRQVAPAHNKGIDYAIITHFHDDHFGNWYPWAPPSAKGNYVLTGITGLAELITVRKLIDRAAPSYTYPYDMRQDAGRKSGEIDFTRTMNNYFTFQQAQGLLAESLRAGSASQISLQHKPASFPSFQVRNVKTGPWIWTGKGEEIRLHFPQTDTAGRRAWPDENSLSLALVLHYGDFDYYTGGDNPGNVFEGDHPLRDVETPIAQAVGEVDVATLDHHGNRDALNAFFIKTLQPRVWIGQSWSADHPGHEVLVRLTSPHISPKPADLFCTNMLEANRIVIGPLVDRSYKSQQGHIVVRVMPGGSSYYVLILDDSQATLTVSRVFGPYQSK